MQTLKECQVDYDLDDWVDLSTSFLNKDSNLFQEFHRQKVYAKSDCAKNNKLLIFIVESKPLSSFVLHLWNHYLCEISLMYCNDLKNCWYANNI